MARERFIDLPHDVLPPLIVGEVSARDWKAWLEPRSGDLIHDAEYFYRRASELGGNEKARNARAAIILGVAAIEAVSNDALVSIYELMIDTWPSECMTLEPWRFIQRPQRSAGRAAVEARKPASENPLPPQDSQSIDRRRNN